MQMFSPLSEHDIDRLLVSPVFSFTHSLSDVHNDSVTITFFQKSSVYARLLSRLWIKIKTCARLFADTRINYRVLKPDSSRPVYTRI
jgi:hypothetical protein